MIGNIRDCTSDETLRVYTNGGSKDFTNIATFKFSAAEVYFNPDSMDNILDIKYVSSIPGVHITMDLRKESMIIV